MLLFLMYFLQCFWSFTIPTNLYQQTTQTPFTYKLFRKCSLGCFFGSIYVNSVGWEWLINSRDWSLVGVALLIFSMFSSYSLTYFNNRKEEEEEWQSKWEGDQKRGTKSKKQKKVSIKNFFQFFILNWS